MSIPHGSGFSLHLQLKVLGAVKFLTSTDTSLELGNCLYLISDPFRNISLVHCLLKMQEKVKLDPKRTFSPLLDLTVHTVPARSISTEEAT